MDSEYLKTHVGKALVYGLSEICQKKPSDPINYLSKWLMKYVENKEYERQMILDKQQLAKEQALLNEEQQRLKAMEEEQNQIAADELLKLESEKSSAQPDVAPDSMELNVPPPSGDGETTNVVVDAPTVEINEVNEEDSSVENSTKPTLLVSDTIMEEEDEEEGQGEEGGDVIADSLDIN